MNPRKDTKTRRERTPAEPSRRRAAQLARLRAEPPALTTKPGERVWRDEKGERHTGPAHSHHLRRWSGR